MTYEQTTVGQTIDRLLREYPDLDPSADGALDNLDQFHVGGSDATGLLLGCLALTEGDRVLDVGSGFGGPARQIARRTGNHVTGIDVTSAYVEAARDLTARTGLRALVEFRVADIATFEPDSPFQAAVTMHVQMNVRDKTTWFAHIARCLAPGAHLAVWEVCQPRQTDLPWPMPWCWFSRTLANGLPAGPALPVLLNDGYTRIVNLAAALGNGSLEVWRGAFTSLTAR